MEMNKLRVGIPVGSLQEKTMTLFKDAGYDIQSSERCYSIKIDDQEIECIGIRPQEMARYISEEKLDLGFTGKDWIVESGKEVIELDELGYAKKEFTKVKWVLAVKEGNGIKTVEDLEGKLVSTELVNVVKEYFKRKGVNVTIEFSWGATEAKPPLFADAIVELTETGSSLKANNLRIIDVVMESTTKMITNKKAMEDSWKKEKIGKIESRLLKALAVEKEKDQEFKDAIGDAK